MITFKLDVEAQPVGDCPFPLSALKRYLFNLVERLHLCTLKRRHEKRSNIESQLIDRYVLSSHDVLGHNGQEETVPVFKSLAKFCDQFRDPGPPVQNPGKVTGGDWRTSPPTQGREL